MVNVNINVENSSKVFEKLVDSDHNVIDKTESTCFRLLSMMKSPRPVDCYIIVS